MKNLKSILSLILFANLTLAQTVEVKYYENSLIRDQEKYDALPDSSKEWLIPNRFSYTLTYTDGISIYKHDDFSHLKSKPSVATKTVDEYGNTTESISMISDDVWKTYERLLFKDLETREILSKKFNGTIVYSIKDQLIDWNWQITDEVKFIEGYNCRKATSDYLGFYFEAWFAEDIPIDAGPEKFDGLPGLILYVRTLGAEYIAYEVQFQEATLQIEKPILGGKTYTYIEVEKKQQEIMRNFKPTKTVVKDGNTTTTRETIVVEQP